MTPVNPCHHYCRNEHTVLPFPISCVCVYVFERECCLCVCKWEWERKRGVCVRVCVRCPHVCACSHKSTRMCVPVETRYWCLVSSLFLGIGSFTELRAHWFNFLFLFPGKKLLESLSPSLSPLNNRITDLYFSVGVGIWTQVLTLIWKVFLSFPSPWPLPFYSGIWAFRSQTPHKAITSEKPCLGCIGN